MARKICFKCTFPKDTKEFNKGKNGQLHSYCRSCQKTYDRDLYRLKVERRDSTKARNKSRRIICREFLQRFLAAHPCVDCGEPDPVVLDFDHVRGKKVNHVSTLAFRAVAISTLEAEIAKCEIRCANCHRRKTHSRRRCHLGVDQSGRSPASGAGGLEVRVLSPRPNMQA